MTSFAKGSSLQDSITSVNPSRLLPTEDMQTYPETIPDEIFNTIRLDDSDAFYVLELRTSREFSSSLVDKNSAILTIKEIWIGLESVRFMEIRCAFLGEGGASVAEVRPVAVSDLTGLRLSDLQEGQLSSQRAASVVKEVKEDGLKEYDDLKQSLLLYDVAIVITGFSAFILASKDSAAYSFLVGGIGGFLYLLLLQRSVDGLPVISSSSEDGSPQPSVSGFSGLRRPWLILSLVMVTGAVALKYGAGGERFQLTPTELFVGTAGFLANKVAVLLAAFKPMQSKSKDDYADRA
ncbi:hypothetical protein QOZ80_3BG0275710 [Eleusine coracana subsp. coracana]|nr:hypothetical protein QOZ80_3BG0275710 [Eleusine coracana subsp. coracana]